MTSRQLKTGCFVLEWLNIYAVIFYIQYLFFHLRTEFGFGNRDNLYFAAANGFVYVFASWFAGRFAQRRGYFPALYLGFGLMALALGSGAFLHTLFGQIIVMLVWTIGTCFSWPTLEALASDRESRSGLARMVGIYNVVWASGAAIAYFSGGALLEWLGARSLFWFPAILHGIQFILTLWLHGKSRTMEYAAAEPDPSVGADPGNVGPAAGKAFLRLAWLANPFAYIAMNTLIPLIPALALRMNLSTREAGFVASVWMFARLFAFVGLWFWTGWHYRFGWLIGAYAGMIASFSAILLVPNLAVIVVAQLIFGFAVGLIYYSSLYYSMAVGESKGEHGGFHEALIGVGLFVGPMLGAITLQWLPGSADAGIWAVSTLLVFGLVVLLRMPRPRRPAGSKSLASPHRGC